MRDRRLTEKQNPNSSRIDELDALGIVDLINTEDRQVAKAVRVEREKIALALKFAEAAFRGGGRLIYVGAGTSGRLGVLDAAEMPPTYRTDPYMVRGVIAGGYDALVSSQEGAEDSPEDGVAAMDNLEVSTKDFVLGIATSGTTPYVHGALGQPSEELLEAHDVVIAPLVGPEVITGSTRMKAGTATKLVLNTITTGAMVRLGKVYGNLMVDLQVTCEKLYDRGCRILESLLDLDRDEAKELLERAEGHVKTAFVMGRLGVDMPEALRRLDEAGGVIPQVFGDLEK